MRVYSLGCEDVWLGRHAREQCGLTPTQAGRFNPIFFIRESNVVGFTPRSSAAPSAPLIFQLAFSRTAPRFSRSRSSISVSVRNSRTVLSPDCPSCDLDEAGGGAEFVTGRSKSSASPREIITALSITF